MYQPFTLVSAGSGGYSLINSVATVVGSVTCLTGDVYVQFQKTATAGVSTGANPAITDPRTPPVTTGWAHCPNGATVNFGQERIADTTAVDSVSQINIYCTTGSEVVIQQH